MQESITWQELFDRSLTAYSAGDLAGGRLACDLLLNHPATPDAYRANARCNAIYYAPTLREMPGYREWLVPAAADGWSAGAPTLIADSPGYLLLARCVKQPEPGETEPQSRISLVHLGPDRSPIGAPVALLVQTAGNEAPDGGPVGRNGLRALRVGGRLMAVGAWTRFTGPDRARTISMGLVDIDPAAGTVDHPRWLLDLPASDDHAWMPAVAGGDLWFVQRCRPTTVLWCDPVT
ncbi:MAG: hypothetical protein ACR2J8_10235, partial [Thermomicrobiales bacterium]